MAHSYFMDPQNRSITMTIYPTTIFSISFDGLGVRSQNKFNISVERLNMRNILQIRICEFNDPTKMFISTIDQDQFEQLKVDQSLNVSFDGFVDNLTKILDSCKRGELFIIIQDDGNGHKCQFYEKRSFRNLVHLYLDIEEAPVGFVLFYINQSLISLQQKSTLNASQVQKLQKEIEYRDQEIASLRGQLKASDNRLAEQEISARTQSNEQVERIRFEMKHATEAKEAEVKKLNQTARSLQERAESLGKEIILANEKCYQEANRADALREEVQQLKLNAITLKEQREKAVNDLQAQKNQDRRVEHLLSETRKQVQDLQEKLHQSEKKISELNAILEAEKQICQTKRIALQIATEEISKANSIILKQNRQISDLKEKTDWRSELVLQQERKITQIEKERQALREKLASVDDEMKENRDRAKEFEGKLNDMKTIADQIERKYSKKLNDLSGRLDHAMAEKSLNKSANRYLQLSNRINPFEC